MFHALMEIGHRCQVPKHPKEETGIKYLSILKYSTRKLLNMRMGTPYTY